MKTMNDTDNVAVINDDDNNLLVIVTDTVVFRSFQKPK